MKKFITLLSLLIFIIGIRAFASISINTQPINKSTCSGYTGKVFTIKINCNCTFPPKFTDPYTVYWYKKYGTFLPPKGIDYYFIYPYYYTLTGEGVSLYAPTSGLPSSWAGQYIAVAVNNCDNDFVISNSVTLTITTGVTLTTHPLSQEICQNSNVYLTTENNSSYKYQWYGPSTTTADTFYYKNLYTIQTTSEGDYRVKVTSKSTGCYAYSNYASINVVPSAASATQNPIAQTICEGAQVSFTTSGSGEAIKFQWQKSTIAGGSSFTDISGATATTYAFNSLASDHNFNYRCKVYNICNPASYTSAANVTVKTKPTVPSTAKASDSTVCASQAFTLRHTGGSLGTGSNAKWAWYSDACGTIFIGNEINGDSLRIGSGITSSKSYFIRGENECGNTNCLKANVIVKTAPIISNQPIAQQRCLNDTVTFKIGVSGYDLTYQWRKLTTPIGGATSSSYLKSNLLVSDTGRYNCQISNGCGTIITSNNAQLTVSSGITITKNLTKTKICETRNGEISITVNGALPITYQWKKNGSLYLTNTSNKLIFSNTTTANEGIYSVSMTNNCTGVAVNSDTATLKISATPNAVDLGNDTIICNGTSLQLDAGASYSYKWSTGATSQKINVSADTTYTVTITNNQSCTNTGKIDISVKKPYEGTQMCMVTVDSISGKNLITWERWSGRDIKSYNIYKQNSIGGFSKIGSRSYDSISVFVDTLSDPEKESDKYKISITDVCNNESSLSDFHKTIHLTTSKASNGGYNLIWNQYRDENDTIAFGTTYYVIYSGYTKDDLTVLDTVPIDKLQDLQTYTTDPVDETDKTITYYKVAAIKKDPCNPKLTKASSGPFSQSLSNLEDNRLKENSEAEIVSEENDINQIKVYPVPSNDYVNISYKLEKESKVIVEISNIIGNKIVQLVNQKQGSGKYEYQFNPKKYNQPNGIYFVSVIINDKVINKKIIIKE